MHFGDIVLLLVGNRLQLMLGEMAQLKDIDLEKLDFTHDGDVKLIKKILKEIAEDEIKSAHISKDEAKRIMKFIDKVDKADDIPGTSDDGDFLHK